MPLLIRSSYLCGREDGPGGKMTPKVWTFNQAVWLQQTMEKLNSVSMNSDDDPFCLQICCPKDALKVAKPEPESEPVPFQFS